MLNWQKELFISVLASSLGVYIVGNLLFRNGEIFAYTSIVFAVSFGFLLIFYLLSTYMGGVVAGICALYVLIISFIGLSPEVGGLIFSVLLIWAVIHAVRELHFPKMKITECMLAGFMAALVIMAVDQTSFDIVQSLKSGRVQDDAMYHASIAAMIKQYGVSSTGLNGLIETPYHTLSHTMFAGLSQLTHVPVVEIYGSAKWFLFAPLLVFSLSYASKVYAVDKDQSVLHLWIGVVLILMIAPRIFGQWALWDSWFVSESYLVALTVFILGMMLVAKKELVLSDLILLPVLTFLMSNAKGSVGVFYAVILCGRVVFLGKKTRVPDLMAAFLVFTVAVFSVYSSASAASSGMSIDLFHFPRVYGLFGENISMNLLSFKKWSDWPGTILWLASLILFLLMHFIVSWLVIFSSNWKNFWHLTFDNEAGYYSLLSVIVAFFALMLFKIPGGSAYYITNVCFFVSLPYLVARIYNKVNYKFIVPILVVSIVIVILCEFRVYKGKAASYKSLDNSSQYFVNYLISLREEPSSDVLKVDKEFLSMNPIVLCGSKPLVYPAISEHAWVGLISTQDGCEYQYYSYGQYFNSNDGLVPQRLLPEMKIKEVRR